MKKVLFLCITALLLFSITSCQKELSAPYSANETASFKENGHTWAGWDIKTPVKKFDTVEQNIYIIGRDQSNAANQLQGKELENSGPKTVYAVRPFTQGNFFNIKSDLERRGWKIAPLSYLLALTKEYGVDGNQGWNWNVYCLNVPVKAVFTGGNPEEFAVQAWGNYYDQNGRLYRSVMYFVQFSNQYGGISVLCYR